MMRDTGKSENFTYWKRPWHPWLILAAGILQLLCLWMNVREYGNVSGAGVLSDLEWERYAAQKGLQCVCNAPGAAGVVLPLAAPGGNRIV